MQVKLPKLLNKAPSARKILEASIADIENGQWLCGSWSEACAIKPQGCAMGLVAINARVKETVTFRLLGRNNLIRANIEPMADGKWPKSARKAAAALAATVKAPVKKAREYADEDGTLTDSGIENIVIEYNDGGIKSRAALNWFNRALASLDA